MYKCCECGCIFEEPKIYSDDCTPGGAFEGGSFINYYYMCPNCGGNYDEALECSCCNELFTKDEGVCDEEDNFYCNECMLKLGV